MLEIIFKEYLSVNFDSWNCICSTKFSDFGVVQVYCNEEEQPNDYSPEDYQKNSKNLAEGELTEAQQLQKLQQGSSHED